MTITEIIASTLAKEGGYVNNPNDKGGETNWGITVAVARANGYTGPMKSMRQAEAVAIYQQKYWVKPGFNLVATVNMAVAEELFDTGVNMGPDVPARWFQEWLNAFNRQGKLYADIEEDGDIGPATIAAFRAFLKARGSEAVEVMLKGLNSDQGAKYKQLARSRAPNEEFVFGWLRTRVGL